MEKFLAVDGQSFIPYGKICRLCTDTDGPFVNIFGADRGWENKINDLLPMMVEEMDGLPHKLCYQCSAKLTEFNLFVKKCFETQNRFNKLIHKPDLIPHEVNEIKRMRALKSKNQVDLSNNEVHEIVNESSVKRKVVENSLKELKIVVTRIEHEKDKEVLKYKPKSKSDFQILNVSGFGTIYTCNYCNAVLCKENVNNHICKFNETSYRNQLRSEPMETSLKDDCISNKTSNVTQVESEYEENIENVNSNKSFKSNSIIDLILKNGVETIDGNNLIYPCVTEKAVMKHLSRLNLNLSNTSTKFL